MGASEQGAPFSCDRWENNQDLSGARLVGAVTFLNVPFDPVHPRHHPDLPLRRRHATPCIPGAGTCSQPCTDDASCDDGDPCNGVEFCHLGQLPGRACRSRATTATSATGSEVCDSANGGVCEPSRRSSSATPGQCVQRSARADPTSCASTRTSPTAKRATTATSARVRTRSRVVCVATPSPRRATHCQNGVCTGALTNVAPKNCEDNNVCNGIMAVRSHDGDELRPDRTAARLRARPNPCTDDGCDAVLGCNPPNTTACDDGNACTGPDICANRECHGDPTAAAIACVVGGTVCGPQACDPTTGACVTTTLNCDDANVCTDDTCNPDAALPADACVHTANTAPCNDNNACTDGDTCVGGKCSGTSAAAATCAAGSTVCSPRTATRRAGPASRHHSAWDPSHVR